MEHPENHVFLTSRRVPGWLFIEYQSGIVKFVSVQIAVRLPDSMVEFLDRLVADGQATSRASVVERALAREFRRQVAARDAAILAKTGADPDMDSLADYAVGTRLDVD
jgi:Arc/MetJ-type ribon-helix-helix transcriptional regulator